MARCNFKIKGKHLVCTNAGCANRLPYDPRFPLLSQYAAICKSGSPYSVDCNEQPKPAVCPHFLGANGETVLLYGCGCASDKTNGVPVTVCECELHGRCVESKGGTHLSDRTVKRCAACEDHPARIKSAEA